MKGAIAAGHPLTADAGARILAEGGNAVDACVAAAFVSWVTESPLTGPGAGGFMLVHRARDRSDRVLDFFVAAPGAGLAQDDGGAMVAVDVPFGADAIQVFRIGAASCGVPGTVAGLAEAHRRYGTLPWRELVAPAAELARTGIGITPAQAFLHLVLDAPLRHSAEGRRIYGRSRPLGEGDRLVMADLARTLERLAETGRNQVLAGVAPPAEIDQDVEHEERNQYQVDQSRSRHKEVRERSGSPGLRCFDQGVGRSKKRINPVAKNAVQ